uniref:SAP domain-containing protein n=1 Tax=Esox lucius TaxID=8010 RepID=A0AAY5L4Q5_ESOLU
MADLEDVTLDGRPLQSLRVADLKAALEERGLPKSGQKNALIKRLKGALMLENLQRTSQHHIGLQPNSQIGEEMSQNSFIKQYLAKQQELLRQRLEREAREAVEEHDTDQEDHTQGNNSSACLAPEQAVSPVLVDQHKPLGSSEVEGLAGPASDVEKPRARDGHRSGPPASNSHTSAPAAVASFSVHIPGGGQRPERVPSSSHVPADSDDDSDGGDDDGEDEDWDSGARRRNLGEPPRGQLARERSGGSRQPPQHIPPLLSPQLRQPTPPPSPPPELSFPLPDTPKQSPPSPGEPRPRQRTSSTSSSGSSSSGRRSSSPEPQGNAERKPGPLTLLARKMASEGAFSGVGWHGRGEPERKDNNAASATVFPGRGPQESTVSAITHTASAASSLSFPSLVSVTDQAVLGGHLPHSQVPVSVLRPTVMDDRNAWQQENKERELQAEREREKALAQERLGAVEQERLERQRILEQQHALEQERQRASEREREERVKALEAETKERERVEKEKALAKEKEEREMAMARERTLELEKEKTLALERQRAIEREQALQREREEKERALEQEEVERQNALVREREGALELERVERERALELERQKALELQRLEKERALERERQKALELERLEKERALELERQKALELERLEKERALELERQKALELERLEKERALELERQKALELERLEKERALELERQKALELERLEKERALELERQKALELERLEKERALELERQKALELQRQEREKALELERLEREKALEQEREHAREQALERERVERQKALEQERVEREKALNREKEQARELERQEKDKTLALERLEREKALERERQERENVLELERLAGEKALELEHIEREKALGRVEKEKVLELQRQNAMEQEEREKEREQKARALEQKIIERENVLEKGILKREKALEREREEKSLQREKEKERAKMAERESHPPWMRGHEIGLTSLPTPPLSTGADRMATTEEGGDLQVPSLPQTASRDNQPAESGTPLSQTLAMPLSPQSFKKFRFLRDPPVLSPSSSASLVIKKPCTFSDSPHSQASAIRSPRKPGEQQEGTSQGPQPSAGKPAQPMSKSLLSEEHVHAGEEEACKLTVRETVREAKPGGVVNNPSVTAVLLPSAPPKEGMVDRRTDRSQKEKENRGGQTSSSSDSSSSDSDSGSSSSHCSASSSSSQGKTDSSSSGRKPEKPKKNNKSHDKETVSQLGNSSEALKVPLCIKHASENEEKDMSLGGARLGKAPFFGVPPREDNEQKVDRAEAETKPDTTSQLEEATLAEPDGAPESSEEGLTPKAFTARRISLSSSKAPLGVVSAEGEAESGSGRKRRWGSSSAVTAKKPSISITTDSLKSLIPRPSPGQEAVVDLHPEEVPLSGEEEEDREQGEQDLQIRRTVTQVVPSDTLENGQESQRSEHEEDAGEVKGDREEKLDVSFQKDEMETQPPSHDTDRSTVTPSDTPVRRLISQQKTGVSVTIDDPVRAAKQPSPPRGKVSNIVHISNLVRPFTLGQLKELLSRTGTMLEEGFWIDKIKSHCYVTYGCTEEAVATRAALHGVKWPQSNPKFLSVDFSQQEELDFQRGLLAPERAGEGERGAAAAPGRGRGTALPPLLPDRDQWAEREREMERRERTRAEREWDRDKVRDFGPGNPGEEVGPRRSRSRERKRKERGKSKERKADKKEKASEEPPAKLLDDLFNKTKAAPCIYWLPLTEEQFAQREAARQERMKEREKRRKELQEEEDKKREEERKERMKASSGAAGERGEGDRERDRGRDREREGDRHREGGYRRPGGSSVGGGRRSRSRSDPPARDRRR